MSSESPKQYTPKETVENRPEVFSSESFPVVMNFAGRLNRLLIPKSSEEEQLIKFDDVLTLRELRARVEKYTNTAVREELADLLNAKSPFQKEDNESIVGAAADKEFDEVSDENPDIKTTALGTALVAERARTSNMKHALEDLPQETLERFGMSPREREIITLLLSTVTKVNTEYMRMQVHTHEKTPFGERPRDTVREKRFISEHLSHIEEKMSDTAKEGGATFGSKEKDEAFLGYILKLKNVYEVFEEGGTLPMSFAEQLHRIEEAQESFTELHSQFPDFPLIVFPAFEHYDADEAAERGGQNWREYGFDPEIRLYWQTKEAREKLKLYNEFRDKFVRVIRGSYSDLVDADTAQKYQILFGDPIAVSGINIKEATLSQSVHNIVIVVEEEDEEKKNILENLLKDERDRQIVSRISREFENKRISLHEFGHGLYSEQSDAAEKLGGYDDKLAELKSDLAMWVSAGEVLKESAEEEFGDDALRALQLSMIEDAMKNLAGETEYKIAAEHILERLIEHAVVKEENGEIIIDTKELDNDLGPLFENSFREILSIYKSANEGKKKDIILARKKAREIIKAKPSALLQKTLKRL